MDIGDIPGQSQNLREACEAWGCFRIVNHKIPLNMMEEMKAVVRSLHDPPVTCNVLPLIQLTANVDGPSNLVERQWRAMPQAFRNLVLDIAAKLAQTVGLSGKSIPFKKWTCQLRMNKCNFTPEALGASGVQVRTDSGLHTILQDDDRVSGLDMMDPSGSFLALDPLPGMLPVNLGDLAMEIKAQSFFIPTRFDRYLSVTFTIRQQIWRSRRRRNVKHLVLCKEATAWVSDRNFPILGPKQGAVEEPPELIGPKYPRLYGPVVYEDFRNLRTSKNLRAGEALAVGRPQFLSYLCSWAISQATDITAGNKRAPIRDSCSTNY
ncbi:Fe2OG dioxygenase domain-containing protein [Psidium guajava]|nr:Fe2OG dioxygenase domain-containing protein [Psidium guajava]